MNDYTLTFTAAIMSVHQLTPLNKFILKRDKKQTNDNLWLFCIALRRGAGQVPAQIATHKIYTNTMSHLQCYISKRSLPSLPNVTASYLAESSNQQNIFV